VGGWPSTGHPPVKYHYFYYYFTYQMKESQRDVLPLLLGLSRRRFGGDGDLILRHFLMGSSAGAAHLLNNNAGVLR